MDVSYDQCLMEDTPTTYWLSHLLENRHKKEAVEKKGCELSTVDFNNQVIKIFR